ncbi:MAG: hypothetical protein JWM85_2122 [Acidimicrobiaceae bacterium]|nr:hypothetical protein [Acidimicrobiaceae bacterium]
MTVYTFASTRPAHLDTDATTDLAARARALAATLEAIDDETDPFVRGEVIRQARELHERTRVVLA